MTLVDQRHAFLADIGRERDDVCRWCRYAMGAVAVGVAVGLACAFRAGDGGLVAGVLGTGALAVGGQQRRLSAAWGRHNSFAARARAATLAELDGVAAEYGRPVDGPAGRLMRRLPALGRAAARLLRNGKA